MSVDVVAAAECLFLAPVCCNDRLDRATLDLLVDVQLRRHGGVKGCAADCAAEYGDHPHEAAARMNWALHIVWELYGTNGHRQAA